MAKYYGDIQCVSMSRGNIHIVNQDKPFKDGSHMQMLCGSTCSIENRATGVRHKYVYRNIEGITCEKCKESYLQTK